MLAAGPVALLALAACLVGGCEKGACLGCGADFGIPTLFAASPVDGGLLSVEHKNECEIDVSFGDAGAGAEALLRVANVGSGVFDLTGFDTAAIAAAFRLRLPTLGPVQPGESYEFGIYFVPPDAGSFHGTLVIETDGDNPACPSPSELEVTLTGTSP